MSATDSPVVTISGSMRFFDRMLQVAQDFTRTGYIVIQDVDGKLYEAKEP